MTITPTDKGSLMAGMGISSIAWLSVFKMDYIAKKLHINRWLSQKGFFSWINGNKSLSILITEVINFAVHGISNPASVLFALGSTLVNAVFIFIVIPVKMMTGQPIHKVAIKL